MTDHIEEAMKIVVHLGGFPKTRYGDQTSDVRFVVAALAEKDKRIAELEALAFRMTPGAYLASESADEAARLRALLAEAREVVELVPTQRVDQIVGTADPTEDEAHDMAVELMNWRRAARALAEKLEKNDDPACGQSVDKSS